MKRQQQLSRDWRAFLRECRQAVRQTRYVHKTVGGIRVQFVPGARLSAAEIKRIGRQYTAALARSLVET